MDLGTIWLDIVYSVRTLRKSPAFTSTAIAAIAIGIGANTAIFSVVKPVLLNPLGYPDAGRIILFYQTSPGGPSYGGSATKFNFWRGQSAVFSDVAAYEYRGADLNLAGGPIPQQVHAIRVSAAYFPLLGAPMAEGRGFTTAEDRPGSGLVAVISYGLWQRRFGADPLISGKAILLGRTPYTIVGVVARGFNTELDSPPDVWLPFQIDPGSTDHAQYFNVIGRLRPGVSIIEANAKLAGAARAFRGRFPNILGPRDSFAVQPFAEALVSQVRPSLLVLSGAVGLVLLIACANVAGLLLARATARRREIAIRAAIGAGRSRIVRQLLIESMVISLAGGTLGCGLGLAGVRALLAATPADLPRIGTHGSALTVHWSVLTFTIALSLITGALFGLAPALAASRTDLTASLKSGGRSGIGARQSRSRSILVAGEMAIALVLLIGAGLLLRTFLELRSVDPGFEPRRVLTLRMSLAGSQFQKTADVTRLVSDATRRIEAIPGVARAAASYTLPLEGVFGIPFTLLDRARSGDPYDGRGWLGVSPGYFEVFRIPVLRGRIFTDRDDSGAPRVAVINQTMARRFWPVNDPVGAHILLGKGYGPEFAEPERQIVGVVAAVHDSGLDSPPAPVVYVPLAQVADGITSVANRAAALAWSVRTRVDPDSVATPVQNRLLQAASLPVTGVRTMEKMVSQSTARSNFYLSMCTTFAACALLLAAIGIYGVTAYSVRQRTQEMGIRMALGADAPRLRNMILLQGIRLAALGIAAGLISALALTRLLSGLLFHVRPWDPVVFASVPVLLTAVTLAAAWLPARRATRIQPIAALRAE